VSTAGPILALDTATPQVSAALVDVTGILAGLQVAGGRRHGELLAPAIAEVCRLAGVELRSVAAVAVDVGPGLFTGLRVGVSTARALVSALGVPGVGLTSLEVLAAAHPHLGRDVVAVVDARRSQVFVARYRLTGERLTELDAPALASPEEAASLANALGDDVLVVGDGALRHRHLFTGAVAGPEAAHPSAAVAGRLALGRPPTLLAPLYLRQPDVRIGWVQRDPVPADG
jgi:tRNA threonylcarbamoyladenosine biosynthesis protein TsaB